RWVIIFISFSRWRPTSATATPKRPALLREPRIVISLRVKSITGRLTSCIDNPTITTRPAEATDSAHCRITARDSTASIATCAPPPPVPSRPAASTTQVEARRQPIHAHYPRAAIARRQRDPDPDRSGTDDKDHLTRRERPPMDRLHPDRDRPDQRRLLR